MDQKDQDTVALQAMNEIKHLLKTKFGNLDVGNQRDLLNHVAHDLLNPPKDETKISSLSEEESTESE